MTYSLPAALARALRLVPVPVGAGPELGDVGVGVVIGVVGAVVCAVVVPPPVGCKHFGKGEQRVLRGSKGQN